MENKLSGKYAFITVGEIKRVMPADATEGTAILSLEGIGEQRIEIVALQSNIRGSISFMLCHECKKRVRRLYLNERLRLFLCRKCCGIRYKTQSDRAYRKTPYQKKKLPGQEKKKMMVTPEEAFQFMERIVSGKM